MRTSSSRSTTTVAALGRFAFAARQRYALDPAGLDVTLAVTNTGRETMPAGSAHHPYIPHRREGAGTSCAPRSRPIWLGDRDVLPTALSTTHPAIAALRRGMRLADFDLDNNFTGFAHHAEVDVARRHGPAPARRRAARFLRALLPCRQGHRRDRGRLEHHRLAEPAPFATARDDRRRGARARRDARGADALRAGHRPTRLNRRVSGVRAAGRTYHAGPWSPLAGTRPLRLTSADRAPHRRVVARDALRGARCLRSRCRRRPTRSATGRRWRATSCLDTAPNLGVVHACCRR